MFKELSKRDLFGKKTESGTIPLSLSWGGGESRCAPGLLLAAASPISKQHISAWRTVGTKVAKTQITSQCPVSSLEAEAWLQVHLTIHYSTKWSLGQEGRWVYQSIYSCVINVIITHSHARAHMHAHTHTQSCHTCKMLTIWPPLTHV